MNRKPALIVHPDNVFRQQVLQVLSDRKCAAEVVADGVFAPERLQNASFRMAVVHEDMTMSDGRNIAGHFLTHDGGIPVIVFSDLIDVRKAVAAIKNGAHDYFTRDSDPQAITTGLIRAAELTAGNGEPNRKSLSSNRRNTIICRSAPMAELLSVAGRVAPSDATVLIEGESGTGKELLARFIHRNSTRSDRPFVAMNCAALPESLAESELFGYDKGAFTGATRTRTGKFEQAQGGTLMLDEISEMPLALQVKLLRVLQEREVDHIGGRKPIPVDVRVVATCNRELSRMVTEGAFRQDLYYRLRVIPLKIPALRERKEDIAPLVAHFAQKFRGAHNIPDIEISPEAMVCLSDWSWPGNVRELENTIERAMLICNGALIRPEHLLIDDAISAPQSFDRNRLVGMTVKEIEKKLIGQTLKHVNENRTHAARMLGISIRTLRNKLREYGGPDEPVRPPKSGRNT